MGQQARPIVVIRTPSQEGAGRLVEIVQHLTLLLLGPSALSVAAVCR